MTEEDTERVKQIISQTIDDIIEYVTHSHSIIGVIICTTGLRECNRNTKLVVSPLCHKQDRLRGGTNRGAPPQDRDPDEAPVHQLWPVSGLGEFTASLSRAVFINLPPCGRYVAITDDVGVSLMCLHFVFYVFLSSRTSENNVKTFTENSERQGLFTDSFLSGLFSLLTLPLYVFST